MSERTMPHDPDAEAGVLGGMLLSREAVDEVLDLRVSGSDFYVPRHEAVFEAIAALHARGGVADAVTVAAELKLRGQSGKVGGAVFLHDLMDAVPTAANAGYYAEIITALRKRRRVIEAGTRVVQMGFESDNDDADEIIDRAQAEVFGLSSDRDKAEELSNLDEMDALLEEVENPSEDGVLTGLRDLDALTHGLRPGQMIVVAARPALGKSTLAAGWHQECSIKRGEHSILFSLEMGRREMLARLLSAEARVPLHRLHSGQMTDGDWDRVKDHRVRVASAPLHIIDDAFSFNEIRTRARALARKHPIKLITVDYLQLIAGAGKSNANREQEVSAASRGLKLLAKELRVPIVAVAQLNRGPEQRQDKKPVMSDLRESGSLEQDADVVILIHREDAYEKESPRAGEADLIVAKHRNGPTSIITVAFQGHYSRFVDMASSSYGGAR